MLLFLKISALIIFIVQFNNEIEKKLNLSSENEEKFTKKFFSFKSGTLIDLHDTNWMASVSPLKVKWF